MFFAVALAVVAANPDALARVQLGRLALKAPTRWASTSDDASSKAWTQGPTDDEEAKLSLSVFPVDPMRPAQACVKQLVDALAQDNAKWAESKPQMVGLNPAAKLVEHAVLGEGEATSRDENKVTTTTVVGCDGRTKWVLTFAAKTGKAGRYGPVLKRVIESITYARPTR